MTYQIEPTKPIFTDAQIAAILAVYESKIHNTPFETAANRIYEWLEAPGTKKPKSPYCPPTIGSIIERQLT